MKILIELPTWLGDCVMATPAIEAIIAAYPVCEVTLLGSFVSTEMMKVHPNVKRVYIDNTKQDGFRLLNLYKLAKEVGYHDKAISFRSHVLSKLFLFLTKTPARFVYNKKGLHGHQVEKYYTFLKNTIGLKGRPNHLKIYHDKREYKKPTFGINPGSTYGSAKRWYPQEFAKVAIAMSEEYDIILFGGPGERDIVKDIEESLLKSDVKNYQNLAGKTTIPELMCHIAGLSLFVTNDSGPMHVAAAYQVPTVAIFGPTRYLETSQWMNEKSKIVRKEMACSPCMKRTCPIKTHDCMRDIKATEVIDALKGLST